MQNLGFIILVFIPHKVKPPYEQEHTHTHTHAQSLAVQIQECYPGQAGAMQTLYHNRFNMKIEAKNVRIRGAGLPGIIIPIVIILVKVK